MNNKHWLNLYLLHKISKQNEKRKYIIIVVSFCYSLQLKDGFTFIGYTEVAGCSAEFVNNVLKNVDSGDKTGGLDIEINND